LTFRVRIRGPYARGVGLMVMIDLTQEKKSLGVISVTRVTETSRVGPKFRAIVASFAQFTDHAAEQSQRPAKSLLVTPW
jgi:hypothetical protein